MSGVRNTFTLDEVLGILDENYAIPGDGENSDIDSELSDLDAEVP